MVKYRLEVSSFPGISLEEFRQFRTLIFFGEDAPEELKEVSFGHRNGGLGTDICPGDVISFDGVKANILDVGERANGNVRELGHLVVVFSEDGASEGVLPGQILCSNIPFPILKVGSIVCIESGA